jgi:hypothetical protein
MMMEFKTLPKIYRYDSEDAYQFKMGEHIIITEKNDGSQFQFKYDQDANAVQCFSKNRALPMDDLSFIDGIEYVQQFKDKIIKSDFTRLRFYGEFLHMGRLQRLYTQKDVVNIFAIYDDDNDLWLPWKSVQWVCRQIGINAVAEFYDGPYIDDDHMDKFAGKSALTESGKDGEGVVVSLDATPIRVKDVCPEFKEVKRIRKEQQLGMLTDSQRLAYESVNFPRIVKAISHLVENDELNPVDLYIENFSNFIKIIGDEVKSDVLEEEGEPEDMQEFIKSANKLIPQFIKEYINIKK